LLRSCYSTCLELAREKAAQTISFPAISAGVYGYPLDEAAEIAVFTVGRALQAGHPTLNEAVFVLFGSESYQAFGRALSKLQ
jgi:O-acetyl-ADP-ribose deacetylase (regulator of RNase III)